MEPKICPDGQNKSFGWRSGKQREGYREEREGEGGSGGKMLHSGRSCTKRIAGGGRCEKPGRGAERCRL